jgi:hypothetical protein
MVGVSSRALYILILAALMKAASMLTRLGSMSIRIMSLFRGIYSECHLGELFETASTYEMNQLQYPYIHVALVGYCNFLSQTRGKTQLKLHIIIILSSIAE